MSKVKERSSWPCVVTGELIRSINEYIKQYGQMILNEIGENFFSEFIEEFQGGIRKQG